MVHWFNRTLLLCDPHFEVQERLAAWVPFRKKTYSNALVKSRSYKVIVLHQLQEGWSSSGWPFLSSWRRGQEGRKDRRQHLGAPSFHSWVQLPLDAHSWQGPEEESRVETCTAPCNRSPTLHALESWKQPVELPRTHPTCFPKHLWSQGGTWSLCQSTQVSTSGQLLTVSCSSDFKWHESQDGSHVTNCCV